MKGFGRAKMVGWGEPLSFMLQDSGADLASGDSLAHRGGRDGGGFPCSGLFVYPRKETVVCSWEKGSCWDGIYRLRT